MIVHDDFLTLQSTNRREFINITSHCREAVTKSGVHNGLLFVMVLHPNSAVFVGDDEPGMLADLEKWLGTIAPETPEYQHGAKFESNGGILLQAIALGSQVTISITAGKLEFGPWQHVLYAELDGLRPKKILFKVMGE